MGIQAWRERSGGCSRRPNRRRPLTPVSGRWRVERLTAPAADIHGRSLVPARTVTVCRTTGPAVVLGSTGACEEVDRRAVEAAGVDVVRRRSGGGAVLVDADIVWVDLVVPSGDGLWDDDVGRAMWWAGETWAQACGALDVADAVVHRGPLRSTRWSRRVCFGGLGAGEVVAGGRKLVGISQRRTRHLALFQTACLLRWDPAPLLGVLRFEGDERAEAAAELGPMAVGLHDLGVAADADAVEAALLDALP